MPLQRRSKRGLTRSLIVGAVFAGTALAVSAMNNPPGEEVVAVDAPTVAAREVATQNGAVGRPADPVLDAAVEADVDTVVDRIDSTDAPAVVFEDGHIRIPLRLSQAAVTPEPQPVAPEPVAPQSAPVAVAQPTPEAKEAAAAASLELVPVEVHAAEVPDPPAPDSSTGSEVVLVPKPYDPWLGVRMCESSNTYDINTGNGFYGAYQFTISTWNWVAGLIGRNDLVGVRPDRASPADQDRMAQALAFEVRGGGLGHWPVCGRYYGS